MAITVAQPAPAIPIAGNGPIPAISSGLSTMSSPTVSAMNFSGVFASPPPRRPIDSMTDRIVAGIAMNTTRR